MLGNWEDKAIFCIVAAMVAAWTIAVVNGWIL